MIKTLDRYIIRNFLYSALLCLVVLMALRIVADLFLNMDEFTEKRIGFGRIAANIATYYGFHVFAYIPQLGGVTIAAAAAFSIARMNHTNELTAMLASGVSLHRVLQPVVMCSALMCGLVVLDRELLIPRIAHVLARSRDDVEGTEFFTVELFADGNNSVWYGPLYRPAEKKMNYPTILIRDDTSRALARISALEGHPDEQDGRPGWRMTDAALSRISNDRGPWQGSPDCETIWTSVSVENLLRIARAGAADGRRISVMDKQYGMQIEAESITRTEARSTEQAQTVLEQPRFTFATEAGRLLGTFGAKTAKAGTDVLGNTRWELEQGWLFYPSDLAAEHLELRQSSRWLDYMSISQLNRLLALRRVSDTQSAILARHIRVTEPLNVLAMLLVCIPFVLSRERNVKAAALRCVVMAGVFYAFVYVSRYLGLPPILAACLPLLVFGPVAAVMVHGIKT